MPYVTTRVEPEEVLRHNDVTVYYTYYYTYKDEEAGDRTKYWFTTDITEHPENEFDIRSLSSYADGKDFTEILREAIDKGEVTMSQPTED